MTLNDRIALLRKTFYGANQKKMNEHRPIPSAAQM